MKNLFNSILFTIAWLLYFYYSVDLLGFFIDYSLLVIPVINSKGDSCQKTQIVSPIKENKEEVKLHPLYVTGLCAGESSFIIWITLMLGNKVKVGARFEVALHSKDLPLLLSIKEFFKGVGIIVKDSKKDVIHYQVNKLSDIINIIIPHFKAYPLRSAKVIDFQLWEQCVKLMKKKDHLTKSGLNELLSIKSALNLGLSDKLKAAFPNVVPISRPTHTVTEEPLDPNWISGFTAGEGCFSVNIFVRKSCLTGYAVNLRFSIAQSSRDIELMKSCVKFFNCGKIYENDRNSGVEFIVTKFSDIDTKILPFFDKYPLQGSKKLDYKDFCEVVGLIKGKAHLTTEGLAKIRKIKSEMNRGRVS